MKDQTKLISSVAEAQQQHKILKPSRSIRIPPPLMCMGRPWYSLPQKQTAAEYRGLSRKDDPHSQATCIEGESGAV